MTSPGGTGMDFGDDYVAARLSIDVPTEGVGQVRELTEVVERFHTAMEAATRSEADMVRYLDQMTDASRRAAEAQSNLTQQLGQYLSLQQRSMGVVNSSGVPTGGTNNPWSGVNAGMGGERQPSSSDVFWQLNQHASSNPREYLNMQAARGGMMPYGGGGGGSGAVSLDAGSINALAGAIAARDSQAMVQNAKTGSGGGGGGGGGGHYAAPVPYGSGAEQRIQRGVGLAGNVMNEIGATSGVGFGGLAIQGLNAARNYVQRRGQANATAGHGGAPNDLGGNDTEDPSGGTGGLNALAKGLGIGGGIATAVVGGYGLVQKGGEMYQGWKNIAGQRGGGAMDGFLTSMKTRGLAMDPNISTDQSRQVYQAMLSEGYADASGNENERGAGMKDFFVNNLKDYNLSIQQQVELLRLSAKGTEASLGTIRGHLEGFKETAATGWLSQQDLQKLYFEKASSLIDGSGVSPGAAFQQARGAAMSFSDDPTLAGSLSSVDTNTPQGNAWLRTHGGAGGTAMQMPAGLNPMNATRYLNETDQSQGATLNALEALAKQAQTYGKDYTSKGDRKNVQFINASGWFFQRVGALFPTSEYAKSEHKAIDLYKKFIWEGETGGSLDKDIRDQTDKLDNERLKTRESTSIGGVNLPFVGNVGGDKAFGSDELDRVIDAYGDSSKIEVEDGKGGWKTLDRRNLQEVGALNNGEKKWRHKGDKGEGITLKETPDNVNNNFSTDDPDNPDGYGGESGKANKGDDGTSGQNVTIDLTDDAKKLLKVSDQGTGTTPNQQAANSGQGGASKNNPPVGDQILGYLGRVLGPHF